MTSHDREAGSRSRVGRRGVLVGALLIVAAVVVVVVVLVSVSSSAPLRTEGARISHLTIASRFVHGKMGLTLVTPAGGGANRPLLVFLHGHHADNNSVLSDQLFAALHALGPSAPDIAFPSGGALSSWHNRTDGAWSSYVLDEVIPKTLTVLGANPRRVAIGGISMGGYGAYALARLDPGRFCAVGGHSPAIWTAYRDAEKGAFDNASDFARNNVITAARTNPKLYGQAQLWLDIGAQDPFFQATDQQLASALHIHMHMWPGAHNFGYWNAHWSNYLGFYAHALATCA
jgi:S-formylglutathione hydrolase FrmB